MKLLLVILAGQAHWFRRTTQGWSEPFIEAAGQVLGDGTSTSRCTWLQATVPTVEVVLDSDCREIDLIWLARNTSRWASFLDRRAIVRRVRQDDPGASQQFLSMPDRRPAIAVARLVPAREHLDWISALGDLMITSITSLDELIARSIGRRTRNALYVLHAAGSSRHLLFASGCLCFSRIVPVVDDAAGRCALEETGAHLESLGMEPQSLTLYCLGVPVRLQQELSEAGFGASQVWLDPPLGEHSPFTLAEWAASLCLTQPGLTLFRRWTHGLSLRACLSKVGVASSTAPFGRWLSRWQEAIAARWRLGASTLTLGVLMAVALSTSVEAISLWRVYRAASLESARLHSSVGALSVAANQLHPSPVEAAAAIGRRLQFDTLRSGEQTREIPMLVAGVLNEHPDIHIDKLAWRIADIEGADESLPSGAVLVETSFGSDQQWRRSLPSVEQGPDTTLVMLEGRVGRAEVLRDRQRRFRVFLQALRAVPSVQHVDVESSPLDSWSTGGHENPVDATGTAPTRRDFRLALVVRMSGPLSESADASLPGSKP